MKITGIDSKIIKETPKLAPIKGKSDSTTGAYYCKYINKASLPPFHSVGESLVFRGRGYVGSNIQKVMDEITNTKAAIEAIESSTGTTKSAQVTEAEQKLSNHNWWQSVKDDKYQEALESADAAQKAENKSHMWGFRWLTADDGVYGRKMDELYYNLSYKYNLSSDEVAKYIAIVDAYAQISSINAISRAGQLKALREKLAALEKNIDFASLQDDINATMNNMGGVEERIAGYGDVKEEIQRTFVEPLQKSVKERDSNIHVPSAVMLYGATGCGKTTFLEAIAEQSKDHAVVVRLSNKLSADTKSFRAQLDAYLADARQRYIDTGKRTIFLLNEAEKFLCMGPEDVGKSGMRMAPDDMSKIYEYNSQQSCTEKVAYFKSLLDDTSKLPDRDDPNSPGSAATIFITTNYPHLIHRDLLSRDGRYGKLMHIAVKPAADNDLRAVLQHYFKKHSNLLEKIKMYAKNDNYADLINSLPSITEKGRATLISKIQDGTIINMHIDPTCSEFPNFDSFIKGNNPSLLRGAYSNARLQNIADKAFVEYLKNPAIPYETHFCNIKNEKGQDISSEAYRYFKDTYDMVQNPEKFKDGTTSIAEDIMQLRQAYLDGILSDKDIKIFELKKQDIQRMHDELEAKGDLTEAEQVSLKQYKEFLDTVSNEDL